MAIAEDVYLRVNSNLEQVSVGGISPGEAKRLEQKVNAAQEKADAAVLIGGGTMTGPLTLKAQSASLYDHTAVDAKWVKDMCQQKLNAGLNLYVGGENASDDVGLLAGRGLSIEMPFASINIALIFAIKNYAGVWPVYINLMEDNLPFWRQNTYIPSNTLFYITSPADGPRRTIRMTNSFTLDSGTLGFSNVKLHAPNSIGQFLISGGLTGSPTIRLQDVEFEGTVSGSTVLAHSGGKIAVVSTALGSAASTISGSVTGKRYHVYNGGMILTNGRWPNCFPGTEDGTTSSGAIYA